MLKKNLENMRKKIEIAEKYLPKKHYKEFLDLEIERQTIYNNMILKCFDIIRNRKHSWVLVWIFMLVFLVFMGLLI